MSKYVRLKAGTICDDGDNYRIDEEGNYCEVKTFMGRSEEVIMIDRKWIDKESDNIEDLFDEYVVDCKHKDSIQKYPFVYGLPKNIKSYYLDLNQDIKDTTIIYGAIWINEGLKYVARMNKDGEWELI